MLCPLLRGDRLLLWHGSASGSWASCHLSAAMSQLAPEGLRHQLCSPSTCKHGTWISLFRTSPHLHVMSFRWPFPKFVPVDTPVTFVASALHLPLVIISPISANSGVLTCPLESELYSSAILCKLWFVHFVILSFSFVCFLAGEGVQWGEVGEGYYLCSHVHTRVLLVKPTWNPCTIDKSTVVWLHLMPGVLDCKWIELLYAIEFSFGKDKGYLEQCYSSW